MGHNRSGVKARLKLRRWRKETARLAAKEAAAQEKGSVLQTVKDAAVGAAEKVGEVIKGAAKAIKNAVT